MHKALSSNPSNPCSQKDALCIGMFSSTITKCSKQATLKRNEVHLAHISKIENPGVGGITLAAFVGSREKIGLYPSKTG